MVVQLTPRSITVDRGSRGFGLSLIYRGLDKYEEKDTGIFVARVVPGGKKNKCTLFWQKFGFGFRQKKNISDGFLKFELNYRSSSQTWCQGKRQDNDHQLQDPKERGRRSRRHKSRPGTRSSSSCSERRTCQTSTSATRETGDPSDQTKTRHGQVIPLIL